MGVYERGTRDAFLLAPCGRTGSNHTRASAVPPRTSPGLESPVACTMRRQTRRQPAKSGRGRTLVPQVFYDRLPARPLCTQAGLKNHAAGKGDTRRRQKQGPQGNRLGRRSMRPVRVGVGGGACTGAGTGGTTRRRKSVMITFSARNSAIAGGKMGRPTPTTQPQSTKHAVLSCTLLLSDVPTHSLLLLAHFIPTFKSIQYTRCTVRKRGQAVDLPPFPHSHTSHALFHSTLQYTHTHSVSLLITRFSLLHTLTHHSYRHTFPLFFN